MQLEGTLITYRQNCQHFSADLDKKAQEINISKFVEIYDRHCREFVERAYSVQQWRVPNITINGCPSLPLIPRIINISFPSLKVLALANNSITSIEGFSRIDAPVLQRINLEKNYITRVTDLRKIHKNLISVDLNSNFIQETDIFNQITWPGLKTIYIELEKQNHHQISDLRSLVKLNLVNDPEELYLLFSSNKRISQKFILSKMAQRHPKTKIKVWLAKGAFQPINYNPNQPETNYAYYDDDDY